MISKISTKQQQRATEESVNRFFRKLFAVNWYRQLSSTWRNCLPIAVAILVFWNIAAIAETAPPDPIKMAEELKVNLDTAWVMIAAMLVIFMNAGFCMLETGFCREKNAVNVLAKNLIVFALSSVAFWVMGFGLMFSEGNNFIGTEGFFLAGADNSPAVGDAYKGAFTPLNWTGVPLSTKFFFQLAFAGTAATIVSGAVAERIKFGSFLVFSVLLVGIVYPITGHWVWGAGWLADMGFYDFAGSTVVHAVGGWAALIGAWILGPRIGRYNSDGSANAMPGHNMSIATLGCLILWLGWFGFNPGSTMSVSAAIGHIAVTTNTGGAFGGIAATLVAWIVLGKPDLSMIINGVLAGLVAVTASCAWISVPSAAIIGTVGGILVVFAVGFFDRLKIDDPVGATSVHLVNGIWGTLAIGLFSQGDAFGVTPAPKNGLFFSGGFEQLGHQIVGTLAVAIAAIVLTLIVWAVVKALMGIRVTREEEMEGLDLSEHGMEAYPRSSGGASDYHKTTIQDI